MPDKPRVREMTEDDSDDIAALLTAAFGREDEARLVTALQQTGDLAVGLVAELDGSLSGIAALSRLREPDDTLALGPIAVAEPARHQGIGGALIEASIAWATEVDAAGIFVLGRPRYYTRFGFSVDCAAGFAPDFMLAVEIGEGRLGETGSLIYPPAFAALG